MAPKCAYEGCAWRGVGDGETETLDVSIVFSGRAYRVRAGGRTIASGIVGRGEVGALVREALRRSR